MLVAQSCLTLCDPVDYGRRDRLPTPVFLGFPCGSAGKESTCNAGDLDSIPMLERSTEEGKSYPLQYSGLENSNDCIVHGVSKSQTQVSTLISLSSGDLPNPGIELGSSAFQADSLLSETSGKFNRDQDIQNEKRPWDFLRSLIKRNLALKT